MTRCGDVRRYHKAVGCRLPLGHEGKCDSGAAEMVRDALVRRTTNRFPGRDDLTIGEERDAAARREERWGE